MQTYEKDNIAYWSNRASGYSMVNKSELNTKQHQVWGDLLEEKITRQYPARCKEEISVLDVGTGPGFFSILLAEMGYQVTAIDYTEEMLKEAVKNAGIWNEKISFRQMNAEKLEFKQDSFDVLVSRNVTWNLPHPEQAYKEWNRVLKPDGLMLVFDANWYHYLYNENAREGYLRDRKNTKAEGVPDEIEGTDVPAMESIAYRAPLSVEDRPMWDRRLLEGMGMDVLIQPEIWKKVWTKEEKVNNASTPMFLVEAIKK